MVRITKTEKIISRLRILVL